MSLDVFYPVKSLCNSSLFWTDIKVVESVSSENEVWTKGWPDYIRSINDNDKQKVSKETYLKDLFWFPLLVTKSFKENFRYSFTLFDFLIILILIFHTIKKA